MAHRMLLNHGPKLRKYRVRIYDRSNKTTLFYVVMARNVESATRKAVEINGNRPIDYLDDVRVTKM